MSKKQKLCIECQKCCVSVAIYTHPELYDCPPERVVEFYGKRGFDVEEMDDDALMLTFSYPCPNLTATGCAIYETRPEVCRDYNGLEDFGKLCLWTGLKKQSAKKRAVKKPATKKAGKSQVKKTAAKKTAGKTTTRK